MTNIILTDIPHALLPLVTSNKKATLYLNGNIVQEIFIFRGVQFRVNTNRGQFRYDLDTQIILDIELHC